MGKISREKWNGNDQQCEFNRRFTRWIYCNHHKRMVFSENGLPPKIQGSKTPCSLVKWQFQQGKKYFWDKPTWEWITARGLVAVCNYYFAWKLEKGRWRCMNQDFFRLISTYLSNPTSLSAKIKLGRQEITSKSAIQVTRRSFMPRWYCSSTMRFTSSSTFCFKAWCCCETHTQNVGVCVDGLEWKKTFWNILEAHIISSYGSDLGAFL